jgi:hypothetical protein
MVGFGLKSLCRGGKRTRLLLISVTRGGFGFDNGQVPRLQPRKLVVDLKSLLAKLRPEVIGRAVREGDMNTEGSKADCIPESPS